MSRAAAGLIAGLIALTLPASGRAEKPTKVEIARRGKAATAFVSAPNGVTGTAFCVHPSGLFLTTSHAVRGAETGGEVKLVLNPSLESQKVLKARVVRLDKDLELALLRVGGEGDLPSLALGSAEGVTELADVVACGFATEKAPPAFKADYPAISVNAGTVTSLGQKGGQLRSVLVNLGAHYANYGGPLLDDGGKVVGVLATLVAGKPGINEAIPVNRVEQFLKAPDVAFAPPELTAESAARPQQFRARVASLLPGAQEPSVRLVLQAGEEKPREYPMRKVGGEWVATATPVPKAAAPAVELTARFGAASVTGSVEDAEFTVGGKAVKLSAARRIDSGPKPVATLADGKTLEGEVGGLGAVEVRLGDQKVKLDLSKATQISLRAGEEATSVSAAVVVTAGGKEVARATGVATINRTAAGHGGSGPPAITPPALAGDRVTKELPETYSDAAVAGGGRYLVFQLPKLKKLAVFDVSAARVAGYIPLAEEKAVFAAGLDAVIVGLPGAGRLERWSLANLAREKNVSHVGEIRGLVMGHASTWAVVVDGVFLDPATLKPLPMKYDDSPAYKGERAWIHEEQPIIPSADGTVFANWNPNLSPSHCGTRVLEGGVLKRHNSADLFHTIPGPDGRWVYTSKGVLTRELKYASADDAKYGYCLPATSGGYFLSLTSADNKGAGGTFTVYHRGMKGPLGRLEKADHGLRFDGWGREGTNGPWRRVFFVPEAKVIAVLPVGNDRVVLHRFDVDEALEKSGLDYLFVASQPPREAKAGSTLAYPLQVKSKHGGLTYKIDSGPKGLAVSAAGVVTWAVPADAAGDHEVVMTVKDKAGQEAFHAFKITVAK